MAFNIERNEGFIEVHLWGEGQEGEVLTIVQKLKEMAPKKEIADLWMISKEYVLPWACYLPIVEKIANFTPINGGAMKSAIVVSDHFQMAQAQFYLEAAKCLPFAVGAFMTRNEAIRWLAT